MRRHVVAAPLALLPLTVVCWSLGCAVDAPDAPTMTLSTSPIKMFDFSWEESATADHYQLLESAWPYEPFELIVDDILDDGISLAMPLHLRHEARYLLRACNDAGCMHSSLVSVTGSLADAIGYFKASNTDLGDSFGSSVALSGDGSTLAVAASSEGSSATGIDGDQADDSADGAGAVYVFVRDAIGQWQQQAYVKASNPDPIDHFGTSIALSEDGSTLLVGAPSESSSATGIGGDQTDDSAFDAGAVYVFVRNPLGAWAQQAYVKASNADQGDGFGTSVASSADGNTFAVGAPYEGSDATGIGGDQTDDSAVYAGAVYVFTRDAAEEWYQEAYIKASNSDMGDFFGNDVALSGNGNTLAVGATSESSSATGIGGNQADDSALRAGAVYVFERSATDDWYQQAYVKASNTDMDDHFGSGVALSHDGDTLAVGALGEASSITGNQADDAAPMAGAVYVFQRSPANEWSQRAYVKSSDPGAGDRFGAAVAMGRGGDVLAIGASEEDGNAIGIGGDEADDSAINAGAVFVFVRSPTNQWSQRAYVKAPNPDPGDRFGASVALSGDHRTLAVGAYGESSDATGIGGNQASNGAPWAGAVYLY